MADMSKFVEQMKDFDINDVDWDRVGVWPLPVRCIIFILVLIVVLTAAYFLSVKEQNATLVSEKSKEVTLSKSFEEKAHEAANLSAYRAQMREMETSFDALKAQLPSDIEVPDLLEDIDSKVVSSRLGINGIDPQDPVSKEFYIELPIQIDVVGGYHEFGAFVSGIAGMSRIVTLHDFEITRSSTDGNNSDRLGMTITAKTYKYKAQE